MSNSAEIPPSPPPRVSPLPSVQPFPQSRAYSTISPNSPLSWQPPILHLPVPQLYQAAHAPYNPSTYGFISNVGQSPVNPPWAQRESSGTTFDTSRLANPSRDTVNSSRVATHTFSHQDPVQVIRPPLPVRLYPASA